MADVYHYVDQALALSLDVPAGWSGLRDEHFPLTLLAPEEHGYQAHMSFMAQQLVPPTEARLEQLVRDTYQSGSIQLPAYRLLDLQKRTVDAEPAFSVRYQWEPAEIGQALTQLDLLILARAATVYVVHCYTLQQLQGGYLPVFEQIIDSIRFEQL
jgi:hypothetical protein